MAVKHHHQTALADDPAADVSADEWNEGHDVDDNTLAASKLAMAATSRIVGRATAGAGAGEELTIAQVVAMLADNTIGVAKLAAAATARVLGRKTSGAGAVEELTAADVATLLTGTTLAPAAITATGPIGAAGANVQAATTFASGVSMGHIGAPASITSVNSKTYTITVGGNSGKLFILELGGSGGAAMVWCSYESATITITTTNLNIVASSTPSANQIGISKSAGSHDVVIKTGSGFAAANGAAWTLVFLGSQPTAVVVS